MQSMIKNYTAVIFDMDGVIFDSERIWARFDGEADELFHTGFDRHVRDGFCGMDERRIRERLKELRPALDADAYREYIISHVKAFEAEHGAPIKRGAVELITALKNRKVRLALATSSHRERAHKLFDKAGLDISIFDEAVFCEDVRVAKPDPDIFLTAAKRLNAKPNSTVVIEDSTNGIAAAYAGGFIPIMALDLIPPPKTYLSPPYSLAVANDLFEAAKLLGIE